MKQLLLLILLTTVPVAAQIVNDVPAHPYVKFETTEGDMLPIPANFILCEIQIPNRVLHPVR
jgi:hypothetical protein